MVDLIPTNYTAIEGGDWLPSDGVDLASTPFAAVMFADGTVWDQVLNAWRGNIQRDPFVADKVSSEPSSTKMGRPTDYTPELGAKILDLMNQGLSLAAAAADCNIYRQRVYDWVEKYPDFADTISLAKSKRQLFLEKRLLSADQGPVVTSTIFALKNAAADDWREKTETATTITPGAGWAELFPLFGNQTKSI